MRSGPPPIPETRRVNLDKTRAMIKARNIAVHDIAAALGVSKTSAQKYINELIALGEIKRVGKVKTGSGITTAYALLYGFVKDKGPEPPKVQHEELPSRINEAGWRIPKHTELMLAFFGIKSGARIET